MQTDTQTNLQKHAARITDGIYRCMHLLLDDMERRNAPMPEGPLFPAAVVAWRFANSELGFWRLCENRGCRRARRCCGEPRACLDRHLPTVPQKTRDRVREKLRERRLQAAA